VDAVALAGQIDPHRAHGIVRPRFDGERLAGMHALEVVFRVIVVGRVTVDFRHPQGAGRGRLLLAADRRGVESDQRVRVVEQQHGLPVLVDLHLGRLRGILIDGGVDYGDGFPGAIEVLSRVQGRKQILAHVKLLGQALARAGVGQLRNVLHVLHLGRELAQERPGDIAVRDGVARDHRTAVRRKLGPDVGADVVGTRQLLRPFISPQRLLRILTKSAVDLARREVRPVEQHLQPDTCRGRLGVRQGLF
jgi:hypothetical protein